MDRERLYLNIINNLHEGVYFVDINRSITFWNKAAEAITGYSSEEVLGRSCVDNLLGHINAEGTPLCTTGCPLYATLIDGLSRKSNVFLRHRQGHRIPILISIFPMYEGGEIIGAIEIFTPSSPTVYDDTLVEKLSNSAMQDALTELPNRRYLESYLLYKVNEYHRLGAPFFVLFMDIDDFSHFNDSYGHDVGDSVLKNLSLTILKSLRTSDFFGRWGGEEFMGIFTSDHSHNMLATAEKLRMLVANTQVVHKGNHLNITVSIGATAVREGDTIESILERADHLMYQSKKNGKNRVSHDIV